MTNENAAHDRAQDIHDQLRAAELGGGRGSDISRSARRQSGFYTAMLGASVALFLLAVVYVYPTHVPWLVVTVTMLYAAGIGSACIWFARAKRASNRGWTKRYTQGLALTMSMYALGVALTVSTDLRTAWFWVPFALLTAAPVIVAGVVPGRAR
jgi:hypothetical protein